MMADKVPRLLPGVDIRKFKLDPMDGFLLTRIDGKLGPKELARETGLPDFSVSRTLEKLEKLGIIQIVAPGEPLAAAPVPEPPQRQSTVTQFEGGLLAPKYDLKELEEAADLPAEQKKRILDFYYRLDDLDHYTLLGVTSEANKKGIKRAYFELAALFHPDRYYKKELGSFKGKMEVLFNRITEAHDTLVDAAKRSDYDAYLSEVATTRGMEAMLERAMADSARSASEAEKVAAAAAATAVTAPPSAAGATTVSARPAAMPSAPPSTALSPEEIQRRKDTLALRLTGGARPSQPSRPISDQPNPLRYSNSQDAVDALKRRYLDRIEGATQAHAGRYVQAAEDALAKNDLVAASTALNIATKFAPDDVGLAMRAQEAKNTADKLLCESYLKQAQYEERQGHWLEAGRSWQKVAKIRNDAVANERAAHALLHTPDGDLHEAAEHAKRAITLQPDAIANHVTLVEIYLKAGLAASARRAAEAANALDPNHAPLQALLKRIGKS